MLSFQEVCIPEGPMFLTLFFLVGGFNPFAKLFVKLPRDRGENPDPN